MLRSGMAYTSGNMPEEIKSKVRALLIGLRARIDATADHQKLRVGVVRHRLNSSIVVMLDRLQIHVCGQPHLGTPEERWLYQPTENFSLNQLADAARWDLGFQDPFGFSLPANLLSMPATEKDIILQNTADNLVKTELQRVLFMANIVQLGRSSALYSLQ
jgi:hypothetical protein